jgi:hypothetical protein
MKKGRGPEKKQASLCAGNVPGRRRRPSREIKLKESEHEGHLALRKC